MSTASQLRRKQEKEALRRKILTAAIEVARETGSWEKVTVRKIAEKIAYSTIVLYSHFKNRHDLLQTLFFEGNKQLRAELKTQIDLVGPNEELLPIILKATWEFSLKNPELYYLMNFRKGMDENYDFGLQGYAFEWGTYEDLIALVQREKPHLSPEKCGELMMASYALLNGYWLIYSTQKSKMPASQLYIQLEQALKNLKTAY